jgi:ubiquinone/menaquinone biosynthesis C-methylase UbiE
MKIKHYFSRDENKRSEFIFNLIAPLYSKMNHSLGVNYSKVIMKLKREIEIDGKKVLDIGSGTGVWSAVYKKHGAQEVLGIDFAENMVSESNKNYPDLEFIQGDAENLHQLEDNSFDIVTASYVIHGVTQKRRVKILSEMKRISRKYIVLHDFKGETPLFVKFLEFMERSDYKHFKQNICNELKSISSKVEAIDLEHGSGLYIINIENKGVV